MLLTCPEWHIVHAYADYGTVIGSFDPHDYGFLTSISGFWSLTCALSKVSGELGGFNGAIRQTIYTIGVSFTAELLSKAAFEETIGRLFTLLRGGARAPLDDLSAWQAIEYAISLQQVPSYEWDFTRNRAELEARAIA